MFSCQSCSYFLFCRLIFTLQDKCRPTIWKSVAVLGYGFELFSFIPIQTCQTTALPPSQTQKKIQEKYCAVVKSGKRRHVTKYRNVDMCSTGHVMAVQKSQKRIYFVSLKTVRKIALYVDVRRRRHPTYCSR